MRHTTILLATCLLLAGAGCSDGGGDTAESKPSASAAQSPVVDPVVPFMRAVEDARLASYSAGVPPYQELEIYPPLWCRAIDDGHSVEWMFDMTKGGLYPIGEEWGTTKADAHQVLLMGVEAYCPKQLEAVRADLRASGEY